MLLGGRTGSELAEEAEQGGCGFLIGEVFECYGCGEMRRLGIEAYSDEVFVAPRGESLDDRAEFDRPVFFGCQDYWAGTSDGPCTSRP